MQKYFARTFNNKVQMAQVKNAMERYLLQNTREEKNKMNIFLLPESGGREADVTCDISGHVTPPSSEMHNLYPKVFRSRIKFLK